jgi:hypothetical protein
MLFKSNGCASEAIAAYKISKISPTIPVVNGGKRLLVDDR